MTDIEKKEYICFEGGRKCFVLVSLRFILVVYVISMIHLPAAQISRLENRDNQSIYIFTFTFSHLADAFIQRDLQGCIHIFTFTLMAHCTSGAIRGSVSCSRTLRQGIEYIN